MTEDKQPSFPAKPISKVVNPPQNPGYPIPIQGKGLPTTGGRPDAPIPNDPAIGYNGYTFSIPSGGVVELACTGKCILITQDITGAAKPFELAFNDCPDWIRLSLTVDTNTNLSGKIFIKGIPFYKLRFRNVNVGASENFFITIFNSDKMDISFQ